MDKNSHHYTLLHISHQVGVTKLLLDKGANVEAQTPLMARQHTLMSLVMVVRGHWASLLDK